MDLRSKLVFMHEHVMNNQEHVKNIRTYSMKLLCFNFKFSSWQHKQTVREGDYTFMQDLCGGGGDSWWRS